MAAGEHKGPPRRLTEGGDWAARLLSDVRAPAPTSADRERVWASVRARRSSNARRWLFALAPVAACAVALAFVLLRPGAPINAVQPVELAPITLTLASGQVSAGGAPVAAGTQLASGVKVRTEVASRAHLRFFDSTGLLMREGTDVQLAQRPEGAVVVLGAGSIVASVAPQATGRTFAVIARDVRIDVVGTLFSVESSIDSISVRVAEGVVSIQRVGASARVAAGECWSSARNTVEACGEPADSQTARALSKGAQAEGRVVIEGDVSLDVLSDGIALGHPPIQWWTDARTHSFEARAGGERVDGSIAVEARREVRLALALPTPSTAPAASPVVVAHRAPVVARPQKIAVEPTPEVVAAPTPSPAAPPVPDPSELYQEAMRLAREGQFEAAARAFESLSTRRDRFAELALYELGRLRQRSLKDPAGALLAFDSYRQRFAAGTLRHEVDFSAIDAALSLGDSKRALGEADAFLSAHPRSERERSVRRIRADLLRESGDCASALGEYLRLLEAEPSGPDADDLTYDVALCEARQGNPAQARERLEGYLQRFPAGKHRAEATKALANPGK